MPFNVVVRRDLSLAELYKIHQAGGSVMKSPHVGNIYPNNLAVASVGIPMNFYDRTIGERDKNFHPHRVIVGGESETIANHMVLTTHARVERESKLVPGRFPLGARTIDCHMRALRDAMPDANCEVYTDYVHRFSDRVLPVLELITDKFPQVWERTVSETGRITEQKVRHGWCEVKNRGVFGLPVEQISGWVVPNVLNVLLDGVVESTERGIGEVYHLSGPDMVRYIHRLEPLMHQMYDYLRTRLDWKLPEHLQFNLVPVADMRFAVRSERRAELNELVNGWRAFQDEKRSRGEAMKVAIDSEERQRLIAMLGDQQDQVITRIRAVIRDCAEIFYRIEDANTFTQYDLLAGAELYVHPWGVEASMQEVSNAFGFLSRMFENLGHQS